MVHPWYACIIIGLVLLFRCRTGIFEFVYPISQVPCLYSVQDRQCTLYVFTCVNLDCNHNGRGSWRVFRWTGTVPAADSYVVERKEPKPLIGTEKGTENSEIDSNAEQKDQSYRWHYGVIYFQVSVLNTKNPLYASTNQHLKTIAMKHNKANVFGFYWINGSKRSFCRKNKSLTAE